MIKEYRKKECLLAYLLIMDETGHHMGYESPEYIEALKKLDRWIGRIIKKIDSRTKLIITTDHGGMNWDKLTPTQQRRFNRLYGSKSVTRGVHGLPLPKMTQSFLLLWDGTNKKSKNGEKSVDKNGEKSSAVKNKKIGTIQYHEKIINWINGLGSGGGGPGSGGGGPGSVGNGHRKITSKK